MKFLIALSAFVKGDRLLYRAGKNRWYAGTVTSVRQGRVGILFDDGVKGDPSEPNARSWKKLASTKKFKKPLTDEQAKTLIAGSEVKLKPGTRVTPTGTKIKIAIKEPEDKLSAEEQHLVQTIGLSREFATYSARKREGKLHYLRLAWSKANKEFFSGRLQPCALYLQKDMGTTFRRRGVWFEVRRKIGISPRLFLGNEAHVLTTLVHEMCHQAVSEIDRVHERQGAGHGPIWESYMRKCGLTPSRYSKYDNETFMTEEERTKHVETKERMQKERSRTDLVRVVPRELLPVKWYSPQADRWISGIIACRNDQAGKRWAVVSNPLSDRFNIVPNDWLYALPKEEIAKMPTTEVWSKAIMRVQDHLNNKRVRRANKLKIRQLYQQS